MAASALVLVHVGGQALKVIVTDDIWMKDPNHRTLWGMISYRMSKSTITGERLEDGQEVVINWGQVQAVSYVSPW